MTSSTSTEAVPFVQLSGIRKRFGTTEVLKGIDLDIYPGEIVALLGENGAGKSTLIKILTGFHQATAGTVSVDGELVTIDSPAEAEALGIRVIHQDRHLAGRLTVAEQFFLGAKDAPKFAGQKRRVVAERNIRDLVGLSIHGDTLIDDLTVAEQQLLQIAIAIREKPRLLVLDEPTAPLAAEDIRQLFSTVASLKQQGIPMIYISHYLEEVREISDRAEILRNGEHVGSVRLTSRDSSQVNEIVSLMVGEAVTEFSASRANTVESDSDPLLEVTDLQVQDRISGLNLEVRPGEVVAVTGLVGSGIEELAEAITGLLPVRHGQVRLKGRRVRSPWQFVARGGAYVPSNRRRDGVVGSHTIDENLSLASLGRFARLGWVNRRKERVSGQSVIDRLRIRPDDGSIPVAALSGGNQQKVSVGKWLAAQADVFILDQPTAGVDIGSRSHIYREIVSLVDQGAGVLLVSVDLEEVVGLADRTIVLFRGRPVAELTKEEFNAEILLTWSTGASTAAELFEDVSAEGATV